MTSLISVGQVLDHSLEHCRRHFKELLAITLWVVVAAIPSVVGKLLAPNGGNETLTGGDWLSFAMSLIGIIVVMIVSIWMYATLVYAVADQAAGRDYNLKQLQRRGWQAFTAYLILTLTLAAIVFGIALITVPGYVLLFLSANNNTPAFIGAIGTPTFLIGLVITLFLLAKYSVQLAFAPYVLLLERKNISEAIKGSSALVTGRWWSTFWRFAMPKLIYFIVLFVLSFITFTAFELLLALIMNHSGFGTLLIYTLSLFVSVFLSAIITPLIVTTDYYLYDSLRKTR